MEASSALFHNLLMLLPKPWQLIPPSSCMEQKRANERALTRDVRKTETMALKWRWTVWCDTQTLDKKNDHPCSVESCLLSREMPNGVHEQLAQWWCFTFLLSAVLEVAMVISCHKHPVYHRFVASYMIAVTRIIQ